MSTPAVSQTATIRPMAVIYLRVSTKDQAGRGGEAEGFSIPAQRDACLRQAEALGAQVVAEFVDAGESARSANRPELRSMLAFVTEHKVGFVIVHKLDRLARSRVDDVAINVQLTAAGTRLISCTENIDDTPSGMLMHGIMSSIAEFYSRNLATESKKGMRQKVKTGGTVGMAPFGYINTRERASDGREIRTVVVDPERAPWVEFIFEKYVTANWTAAQIRDELAAQDVTSVPRPNRPPRPLALSQIYSILRNRYYIGIVTFEGVEYEGKHPKLISEPRFAAAQRIRDARHQSKEKPRLHSHCLKGSIYCGECGQPLTYERPRNSAGVHYEYFYCMGRQNDKNGCTFRAVPVSLLEELVERHWASVTLGESKLAEIREHVEAHIETVLPSASEARKRALAALDRLQRQSDKLLQAHYEDAITLADLKREQHRIASQRAAAELVLDKASLDHDTIIEKLDQCCRLLANAQDHYLASDGSIRRDLNQAVFRRLYVLDDEIVASDLTPTFRKLVSPSLPQDLVRERKVEQTAHVRTRDLYVVPDERGQAVRGARGDLPRRSRDEVAYISSDGLVSFERPLGPLSWERKNPGPEKVRGSNELLLVAPTGLEPVTLGL